jgi:HEXXH motif-containing protein
VSAGGDTAAGQRKPHSLTRRQFDSLATGLGDEEALETLSRAQLSKRLLLLQRVRFTTDLAGAPAWPVLDAAMASRPQAARAVLGRPFVDVWACRVLRRAGSPANSDAGYLTGLAAAAAVVAGVSFEVPVPAGVETLLLPGVGRISGLDGSAHELSFDGVALRLVGAGTGSSIRPGQDGDVDGWSGCRVVRCPTRGGPVEVELDDLDPYRSCFGAPPTQRLDAAAARRWTGLVEDAISLVDKQIERYAPTVRWCLRSIVPVVRDGEGSVSASNENAFGAVAASFPGDAAELALLLVHESQHGKLGALLDLVHLVDPESREVYHAPWRSDPRPAGPLLQGTYAHFAVADFWRLRMRHVTGEAARVAAFEYAYWRTQASRGAETLARSSALTELGRSFVERLGAAVAGWDDDVEPDLRRAVATCTRVTDVQWRLRNHRVVATQLADLVDAYRSGRPCPPVPPPQVVPGGGTGGSAMAGAMVRRLRQRAIGAAAADEPADEPAADAAADALDFRLRADPVDSEAWALLSVRLAAARGGTSAAAALGITERPELVRGIAAGSAAGGDRLPAATVAAWLAAGLG